MMEEAAARRPVDYLPADFPGLARHAWDREGEVLYALGPLGGVRVDPHTPTFDAERHDVRFGRDDTEVRVHVGAGDPEVSRRQGWIYFDGRRWHLQNTGELDLRLPSGESLGQGHEVKLPHAYYPVFIDTPRGSRTYTVEIRVSQWRAHRDGPTAADPERDNVAETIRPPEGVQDPSLLKPEDRLVLVAMARHCLIDPQGARPQSYAQSARELESATGQKWTARMVDNRVRRVRERLVREGLPGLRAKDFQDRDTLGNTINQNLISIMMDRGAITIRDLQLLDGPDPAGHPES